MKLTDKQLRALKRDIRHTISFVNKAWRDLDIERGAEELDECMDRIKRIIEDPEFIKNWKI